MLCVNGLSGGKNGSREHGEEAVAGPEMMVG